MPKSYPKVLYTDDAGVSHPIRMEAGDVAAQPTAATTGTPTNGISAKISGGTKKEGLRARYVTLTRSVTGGTGGTAVTRSYNTRLAILKLADWQALVRNGSITVNGNAYTINSKVGEVMK